MLNDEAIELIDTAIRGRTAFTLSGPKTLTSTNGVANEARSAILHITGGTGGTVTVPNLSKPYLVINGATGAVTITAGGMTTASVAAGETAQVAVDGVAAVRKVIFSDFDGSKLRDVGNPSDPQDAATKAYVDSLAFDAVDLPGQDTSTDGAALFSDGVNAEWRGIDVDDVLGAAPISAPSFTDGVGVAGGLDVTGVVTQTGGSVANVDAMAALDIDFSLADGHTKSISTNSAFTFSGFVAGKLQCALLTLTISSSAVPSWPASVRHPTSVNPSTSLGNGKHLLGLITSNGGTDVVLVVLARNFS
ncbi:MAG: hypothetical protein V4820_11630 [Pseudomonadota bacterium]